MKHDYFVSTKVTQTVIARVGFSNFGIEKVLSAGLKRIPEDNGGQSGPLFRFSFKTI